MFTYYAVWARWINEVSFNLTFTLLLRSTCNRHSAEGNFSSGAPKFRPFPFIQTLSGFFNFISISCRFYPDCLTKNHFTHIWVQKRTGQFLRELHAYSIDNFVAFPKKKFGSDTDTETDTFGQNSAPIPNFGLTLFSALDRWMTLGF